MIESQSPREGLFNHEEIDAQRYRHLTEMWALVVHDLASPLQNLALLAEELDADPTKASGHGFRDSFRGSVAQTLDLVNSVRAFIKDPGGEEDDHCTPVAAVLCDVNRLITIRFLLGRIQDKEKPVRITVVPAAEAVTCLSRADLMHVMINLMSNAVEAARSATNAEAVIEVTSGRANDRDYLVISDNGAGLTQAKFDALTLSGVASGCRGKSMGMRLVRQLVERHGGSISILSTPLLGCGTSVRIDLPKPRATAREFISIRE